MTLEEAKADIRQRGFRPNPWRVGRAMGRAYANEFRAWREEAKRTKVFTGRPVAPSCPYAVGVSVRAWEDGFRMELPK